MPDNLSLPQKGRLLSLDFGERRIGIAVTDELQIAAQARETLHVRNLQSAIQEIKVIVQQLDIQGIVIGLPLSLSGLENAMSQRVRQFAKLLEDVVQIPIAFWDERLTSLQAERTLREFDKKPSRHKAEIDRLAASFILRTFLDHQKR